MFLKLLVILLFVVVSFVGNAADVDDRGNPDIRSRHVAHWMEQRNGIDVDKAKGLLERLGYKPFVKVSQWKMKINL